MAFNAGVHIGPYEILALLGAGGMGEVYKARDTRLHRLIALKILPAEKVADADRKRRFLVEAQAASKLNHPNIVIIHDISEENSVCFIAMEYVPGTTLEQLNAGGGLPSKDTMKYSVEIADALAAAHSAGIIHRDLKPANIIITAKFKTVYLTNLFCHLPRCPRTGGPDVRVSPICSGRA
jgi:serine/threonine protein kinase